MSRIDEHMIRIRDWNQKSETECYQTIHDYIYSDFYIQMNFYIMKNTIVNPFLLYTYMHTHTYI